MIRSMTGYAALDRSHSVADSDWNASWDLRSVNAKGLDLRVRMPDWIPGLEAAARKAIADSVGRGSVTLSLKLSRTEIGHSGINAAALKIVLARIKEVSDIALSNGVDVTPPTALDLLAARGVMDAQDLTPADSAGLSRALQGDLPDLLDEFLAARQAEGAALSDVLTQQISAINDLVDQAAASAPKRATAQKQALSASIARILDVVDIPTDRMMQELAVLATKSDVTEELDRLKAHVNTARDLMSIPKPVGRKLDFLCQEFNREANTLCAKSGDTDLTRIGLELKARIEQVREQIQNVE